MEQELLKGQFYDRDGDPITEPTPDTDQICILMAKMGSRLYPQNKWDHDEIITLATEIKKRFGRILDELEDIVDDIAIEQGYDQEENREYE